ncbi:MAG: PEP/pyruvate-binding domain-containing protein [Syntrophobacteraceae bacterium]
MTHAALDPLCAPAWLSCKGIDKCFVWAGDVELLLALVKHVEDQMNVKRDTAVAGVRVILFVEDSPIYISRLLPILYKEIMFQTQANIEQGLNEEHKLVTMRARPKILVARNFEEAIDIYEEYRDYILGVVSDVRFPRSGELDESAGVTLLSQIKRENPDIPLLLTSSEPSNRDKASEVGAWFLDKNSGSLHHDVRSFLTGHLGFGDFVFRLPNGREITRVSNLRSFEKILPSIPMEAFFHHWQRNDFSRWLFARSEFILASQLRPATEADFSGDVESMRQFIITSIHERRKQLQKAVVVSFNPHDFDPETDFLRIGKGSLGGKARGLVFISNLLAHYPALQKQFPEVSIVLPQTLVLTTEGFDSFMELNRLRGLSEAALSDSVIADLFRTARCPEWLEEKLKVYLSQVEYPLAVRSSSLLEDHQCQPYAGLYRTYMLPNDSPDIEERLKQLTTAIKLVYASTYFTGPRTFAMRTRHRTDEEKMAVIIQKVVGKNYGPFFYPAISGVAQSRNYYPVPPMKPEEGIAHIALGLGKVVMEGGKTVRFSPKYPQALPQFSQVADILKNAQRHFYAIRTGETRLHIDINEDSTLAKREIPDAAEEEPVRFLGSTYSPEENCIKDSTAVPGYRVLTFSNILKYRLLPLPEILTEILSVCEAGMGWPVEIEFSLNLGTGAGSRHEFALLQIRPMGTQQELVEVEIRDEEIPLAFCHSANSLGNGIKQDLADIVYVKPETFDPARMREMAGEIGRLNGQLTREGRKYLLVGPGRWGSADRWLGIPVQWEDISGVGAIVETMTETLRAEPSQGSHFFHNITTLGIDYIMIVDNAGDFFDWEWLKSQPRFGETAHIAHVRLQEPLFLKADGRNSRCAIFTSYQPGVVL